MAQSGSTEIVIISIVFSVLATVAVVMRFGARFKQKAGIRADDYLILPGLVGLQTAKKTSNENQADKTT